MQNLLNWILCLVFRQILENISKPSNSSIHYFRFFFIKNCVQHSNRLEISTLERHIAIVTSLTEMHTNSATIYQIYFSPLENILNFLLPGSRFNFIQISRFTVSFSLPHFISICINWQTTIWKLKRNAPTN